MPREFSRASRVAEVIQREVAQIIQGGMQDPRVRGVAITYVRMSRDMSTARIYFDLVGDTAPADVERILNRATGFIRHELAAHLEMRYVPALRFFHDVSVERGQRLTALIDEAMEREGHDTPGEAEG